MKVLLKGIRPEVVCFINVILHQKTREWRQCYCLLKETIAALREAGESISDRILVVITLKGLPQRYKSFIDVANQRNPPYDYCGLKTAILTYEDTLKGNSDTERVMAAQGNNTFKQKRCFKCGEPGHFASKCYKGGEYKRVNNLNKPQNVNYIIQELTILVNVEQRTPGGVITQ